MNKIYSFLSKKFKCPLRVVASTSLIVLTLVSCRPSPSELEAVHYRPISRDDWKVSTPKVQGLDPMLVANMFYDAAKLETIYSLLVIKNGHLIAEKYFNEGSIDKKDRIQSATKSVTSALVGIAIARGCLSNVDQKMLDFFPGIADKLTDQRKKQITLRNMLEMRTGYPWEESHEDLWKGLLVGHYPQLIKEFPLVSYPGEKFHYSNLTSNWLGIIVHKTCGMNLKAYAEKHLFAPLDVKAGEWGQDAEGHNNGCGDLHLTARDAAKFGLLYLNDGINNGNQIVPADWVCDSLQTYSVNEAFVKKVGDFVDIGYGYHWWSANAGEHHVNFAWGHGGQLIVILKKFNLLVVTTANPFWKEHSDQSWKHEKAIITLVSEFIKSLPNQ